MQGLAGEAHESEIKATYIYNFAKFTEWAAGKTENDPINLCIMGKGSLNGNLEKLVVGKTVKNRPLLVRHISPSDEFNFCHILFITFPESDEVLNVIKKLGSKKILSVSDYSEFIELGGQIRFFVAESKVKIEINLPSLEKAGIKIDARVLNIAKIKK
jgi:hypothetical protein